MDELRKKFETEPEADADTTEIFFRLANGGRVSRRFHKNDQVQTLYDYLRTIPEDQMGLEESESQF